MDATNNLPPNDSYNEANQKSEITECVSPTKTTVEDKGPVGSNKDFTLIKSKTCQPSSLNSDEDETMQRYFPPISRIYQYISFFFAVSLIYICFPSSLHSDMRAIPIT